MSCPDILQYTDHRAFLSDWFQWKKAANPRFSHRMFARLAGQRSPSLLLSVIKGQRNLTDTTAAAFSRAMKLDAGEQAHLFALIHLERSPALGDGAVTVAVPADRFDDLQRAMRAFQDTLRELCGSVAGGEQRYQVSLTCLPLAISD